MTVTTMSAFEVGAALAVGSDVDLRRWRGNAQTPPLVLEATMGPSSLPQDGIHIPTAVLFDLAEIDVYDEDASGAPVLRPGNYNLQEPQGVRSALERHGVQAARLCVVYTQCRRHTMVAADRRERGHHHRYQASASREGVADPIVAARLVWCLAYAGVDSVALLDGGMSAWLDAGMPTSSSPMPPTPADFFSGQAGERFPRHPEYCATVDEVAAVAAVSSGAAPGSSGHVTSGDESSSDRPLPGGSLLGDVRSLHEFLGHGHDYAYDMPCGRIPAAQPAKWGPSTFVGTEYYAPKCGALPTALEAGIAVSFGRVVWPCRLAVPFGHDVVGRVRGHAWWGHAYWAGYLLSAAAPSTFLRVPATEEPPVCSLPARTPAVPVQARLSHWPS